MGSLTEHKEEQPSHYLSVRLTDKQFRELQKTLEHWEIQGDSLSDRVRQLLKDSHGRAVNYHYRSLRKRERIQKEREIQEEQLQDPVIQEDLRSKIEKEEDEEWDQFMSETNNKYEW